MSNVLLLTMEERKPIPGCPDYTITRTGRVFSESRRVACGVGHTRVTATKEIKTPHCGWYRKSGRVTRFRISGRLHTFWVDKLVEDAFR